MPRTTARIPTDQRATARLKTPPSYRQRTGYDQAIVTLTDSRTRHRRDYWLGGFNTPESRECYHRLIAEWESSGRRLPPSRKSRDPKSGEPALSNDEVICEYWRWARGYYSVSETTTIRAALRLLRRLFGSTPAVDFGPNRLRLLRDEMVRGDPEGDPPRKAWSRKYVNGQVHRICAVFKWAASNELLSASVYQQLKTVPSLKRGRCLALETEPIRPVSIHLVEAARTFLSRQVNALISLQLHTGARGGELFGLRPIDIRMDGHDGVWTIEPTEHKTAHHGHARTIYIGPKAQAVIRPFLAGRALDAFLFSPAEAEVERLAERHARRQTPMSCGNRPGTKGVDARRSPPGDRYTADSYRRAIERGCDQAFPPPAHLRPGLLGDARRESKAAFLDRLADDTKEELRAWRRDHRWHPHQLRHTTATLIRREFGLEAARIALGHSSALVTDAVYAERDASRMIEVMQKIG